MNIIELINGLNDVINNNDNSLARAYEGAINPILAILNEDAKLLYNISNRNRNEIIELDIKTFYTEVNLCKTIKRLNP